MKAKEKLNTLQDWNTRAIAGAIGEIGEDLGFSSKIIMRVLRYAMAGLESGVGVPVIIEILGKKKVNRRIDICRSYPDKVENQGR